MIGLYVLLVLLLLLVIANTVILVGLGLFLLKLAAALKENREGTAQAIEDITDMVRLIRANFEDLKIFIRSLVSS